MIYKECDSLALNLYEAEQTYGVHLSIDTAIALIDYVCARYGRINIFFEVLLDDALDSESLDDVLREAYKSMLGDFFNTRAQFKRREMNKVPFAPR